MWMLRSHYKTQLKLSMLRSTRRRPKGAIARTDAVKPFEVEKVSRAETIQIRVMWLKFCFVKEENVDE